MKKMRKTTSTKPLYARKVEAKTLNKIETISKKSGLSKTYIINRLLKKALDEKDPLGLLTNG